LLRRQQRPRLEAAARSTMSIELHLVLLFPFGMSRRPPSWRPSRARVRRHAPPGTEKGLSAGRTCLVVHARYLVGEVGEVKAGGCPGRGAAWSAKRGMVRCRTGTVTNSELGTIPGRRRNALRCALPGTRCRWRAQSTRLGLLLRGSTK
jgi:hypothetical protein